MRIAVCCFILLFAGFSYAQTVPAEQAEKSGFKRCGQLVSEVGDFLIGEETHGSVSIWNTLEPDNRLFSSLISIQFSDGNSVALLNTANGKYEGCDASYSRVFYVDQSCSAVRETIFKEWTYAGELGRLTLLRNKDDTINNILLPGGVGCVTVSLGVVYESNQ